MPDLDYKEKLMGVKKEENGEHNIYVTHITIRQSIFFLHLRLVLIEILAAFGLIVFLTLALSTEVKQRIGSDIIVFNIPIFLVLVAIKLATIIYVIIDWLNEYYEITPKEMIFKKGLLFKTEQRTLMGHIGSVNLDQGILGRIFNFGTLKLFNWTNEKYVYLYLIHNPTKYMNILEKLLPEADREKKVFREHILEPDDNTA